jgi:predicted dehydrogenase
MQTPIDRRQAVVGLALAASTLHWNLAQGNWNLTQGNAEKPKRVGIIGATGRGDYGHGIDTAFNAAPGVEVIAVADADEAGRAAAVARTRPHRSYADYREMLQQEELDVVAVCPRWLDQHHAMLLAAAEAGCHVYMEKPFCRSLEECDEVVAAFQQRNLKLAIAHVSQYSPILDKVLELIANDEIGEVVELHGRGKDDHRGGGEDLWVLGSHVFGLMRSLAGGNAVSCHASVLVDDQPITPRHVAEGAEGIGPLAGNNLTATYRFPAGPWGFFNSRKRIASNPSRFGIEVRGTKGIIAMETGYLGKAHILRDGQWSGRNAASWEPISSAGINQAEPRGDGTYEGGHVAAITDLLKCIQTGGATRCSAEDGRDIVEMIAAVFESSRLQQTVALPLKTRANPLTLL